MYQAQYAYVRQLLALRSQLGTERTLKLFTPFASLIGDSILDLADQCLDQNRSLGISYYPEELILFNGDFLLVPIKYAGTSFIKQVTVPEEFYSTASALNKLILQAKEDAHFFGDWLRGTFKYTFPYIPFFPHEVQEFLTGYVTKEGPYKISFETLAGKDKALEIFYKYYSYSLLGESNVMQF